jgi:hypothetical protein
MEQKNSEFWKVGRKSNYIEKGGQTIFVLFRVEVDMPKNVTAWVAGNALCKLSNFAIVQRWLALAAVLLNERCFNSTFDIPRRRIVPAKLVR